MAYTNIDDPSAFFQVATWTGNGGSNRAIVNDGNSNLQPDWVWYKSRSHATSNILYDSSRGADYYLKSNTTAAEGSDANMFESFDSNGFSLNADSDGNASGRTYVAWQWKANGGTTSSNTDGDLTSTVQFNSTAKFSIITYTGKDPIEPLDIGHGMGEAPDVVIVKNRDRSIAWGVYHKDLTSPAENRYLSLNSTAAESANSTVWRNEAPTSTIIKTGESAILNQPNEEIVMYAWKSVQGFSKFGKYTGNGNADGAFVYTGFKPAFVLVKSSSATHNWHILDNKRDPENVVDKYVNPDNAAAEATFTFGDFLSNGFKWRSSSGTSFNESGTSYIYMAFAENPFVTSTGIPTTAR